MSAKCIVEDVLSNLHLFILSDGSNTDLYPGNLSYSSINLKIVDPSLILDLHWTVHHHFFFEVIIFLSLLKRVIL